MTKTAIIEYNEVDEEDNQLLDALILLEKLPDNTPYSLTESQRILAELKEMD